MAQNVVRSKGIDNTAGRSQDYPVFENLAFQYVFLIESNPFLVSYWTTVIGALIAGVFHRSATELRRAPYFAYSCLLVLLATASKMVWIGTVLAVIGGYLWFLMLVDVGIGLGVGYAFGMIAKARSRDGFGHARLAGLAFIPLLNLLLLFVPPKKTGSASLLPTIPLVTGVLGVLTGFVLLFTSLVVKGYATIEKDRTALEVADDTASHDAARSRA